MKNPTAFPRTRLFLTALAFSVAASGFSVLCPAADLASAPTAIVQYGDLDVATAQGAAALYTRIRGAAQVVCRSFDDRNLALQARKAACMRQAIADAVSQVGEPALYTVYNERNSAPLPPHLLSSR